MTMFSALKPLPWERVPGPSSPTSMDGFSAGAPIADGIALLGWGERAMIKNTWPNSTQGGVIHLAAVRHTEDGPMVGPLLTTTTPEGLVVPYLDKLIADPSGSGVWMFQVDNSFSASIDEKARISYVTVNPETLALNVQQKFEYVSVTNSPWQVTIDPEARLFIATNGMTTHGAAHTTMHLISMDTGAVVAAIPTPLESGANYRVYPTDISFHPERREIVIMSHRVVGGVYRPTIWTAAITATSIGPWVNRATLHTFRHFSNPDVALTDAQVEISVESVFITPRSGGSWEIAANLYADYQDDSEYLLRRFFFTPGQPLVEVAPINTPPVKATYGYQRTHQGGIAYDASLGRTVVSFIEDTDRTPTSPGSGLGGAHHVELDATSKKVDAIIPGTEKAMDYSGRLNMVALGGGRFIYLHGGAAVTQPYINRGSSFEWSVFAAGPVMTQPIPPGIKGGAPDENRRVFRRVN